MKEQPIKTEKREKTVATESYKGVRDFYPEDMFVQKYLFETMRKAVEKFGYVEYNASILEPTELYTSKSGEEIVNEQTYSFKDRGDRDVTLRPEMTPTVARMVAARKRELAFPLRWYSIPNLFRYEKPQRGRLREHFQLNVDLFGQDGLEAEKEIIAVAAEIMTGFGAKSTDFEVRINNRKLLTYTLENVLGLSPDDGHKLMKLLDKKNKMPAETFSKAAEEILGEDLNEHFIGLFGMRDPKGFAAYIEEHLNQKAVGTDDIIALVGELKTLNVDNVVFDPTLVRGFDYYTGIVFEVYDTNEANPRALFGGGRYDDLLSIFGSDRVPAVGFGMGDVTLKDFLEIRNLLPAYAPSADLYIARADGATQKDIDALAMSLRTKGLNVVSDLSGKKIGDQLKKASKDRVPFCIVVGGTELSSKTYQLKDMNSGKATELDADAIVQTVISSRRP